MKKADATRERLLTHARRLMWARGYGAVPLREVAQAAGVDVALVSRYFGNKKGLFEATLTDAFPNPVTEDFSAKTLVDRVVQIFVTAPRDANNPSSMRMIVMNAHDEDVGDLVRDAQAVQIQTPLAGALGSPERAALFMAAALGLSVAEKSLNIKGIAAVGTPAYEAQVRHLLEAALSFEV